MRSYIPLFFPADWVGDLTLGCVGLLNSNTSLYYTVQPSFRLLYDAAIPLLYDTAIPSFCWMMQPFLPSVPWYRLLRLGR